MSRKVYSCRRGIDTGSTFKDLNDSLFSTDFEDLSSSHSSVRQGELNDFIVRRKLDIVQDDQRTVDGGDGSVVESRVDVVLLLCGRRVDLEEIPIGHRHLDRLLILCGCPVAAYRSETER